MNALDVLIVIIFTICMVFSFIKGFIKEIISIVSVIAGIFLGSLYYERAGNLIFGKLIDDYTLRCVAGFFSIFFGIILLSSFIIFIFNRLIKAANLKWLDRFIGLLFGFLKAWLIVTGILLVMVTFSFKVNLIKNSKFSPYILYTSKFITNFTPKKIKDEFKKEYERIYKYWLKNG